MLSCVSSSPGHVVYACLARMISPQEDHLVIVKPHSVEYYQLGELDKSEEPLFNVPLNTTIVGASKFKISGRPCDDLALVTSDMSLIVFTYDETQPEFPMARTVSDQLRNPNVYNSPYAPLFASVETYLFISVYPNSLAVIKFGESLEKYEINFKQYIPCSLFSNATQLLSFDTTDNTIKTINIDLIPNTISTPSADSSSIFNTKKIGFNIDYFLAKEQEFHIFGDGKYTVMTIDKELYSIPLPCESKVFKAFFIQNGIIVLFENRSYYHCLYDQKQFNQISIPMISSNIVDIGDSNLFMTSTESSPVIYNFTNSTTQNIMKDQLINSRSSCVIPHTIKSLEQVIVTNGTHPTEIRSYGYGYTFNSDIIDENAGNSLYAANGYVLFSQINKSIMLNDEQQEVSCNEFIGDQETLLFYSIGDWYIQVCTSCINGFDMKGSSVKFEIPVQHVTSNENIIAISSPQSKSVKIISFSNNKFEEIGEIDVGHEISCLFLANQKYLIVTTWSKLDIMVYSLETKEQLNVFITKLLDIKFVVRSICQLDDLIVFGTSRGDVLVLKMLEDGSLIDTCYKRVSSTTIKLQQFTVNERKGFFIASTTPSLGFINSNEDSYELDVFPIKCGKCRAGIQNGPTSYALLLEDRTIFGSFDEPSIICFNSKCIDEEILRISNLDNQNIALYTTNKIIIFNTLIYDVITTYELESNYQIMYLEPIRSGEKLYLAVCQAGTTIEEGKDDFSEDGLLTILKFDGEKLCKFNNDLHLEHYATSVKVFNDLLYIAVGSTLCEYSYEIEGSDIKFTHRKTVDGLMISSDMDIFENRIALIDALKSIAVYDLSSNDLRLISTDFMAKFLVTGCFIDKSRLLVSDNIGSIYQLEIVDGEPAANTIGRYSVGETITSINRCNILPDSNNHVFVASTSKGSIFTFHIIDGSDYQKLTKLQTNLASIMEASGELSLSKYHSIICAIYNEPYFGFIDAEFLRSYQIIEDLDKDKLRSQCGFAGDELVDDYIAKSDSSIFIK